MMNHEPIDSKDLQRIFDFYKGNDYKEFFRHFPKNLTIQLLDIAFQAYGGMSKIMEDGKTLSYVFSTTQPSISAVIPGILIPKKHHNKGNALKSMLYLLNLCFNEHNINQCIAVVSADEPRVNELLLKGGFHLDCVLTDNCYYDSKIRNENRYRMTKDQFIKLYHKE
jgi:RimJ/RimL family protein N-acetyltransferase